MAFSEAQLNALSVLQAPPAKLNLTLAKRAQLAPSPTHSELNAKLAKLAHSMTKRRAHACNAHHSLHRAGTHKTTKSSMI